MLTLAVYVTVENNVFNILTRQQFLMPVCLTNYQDETNQQF